MSWAEPLARYMEEDPCGVARRWILFVPEGKEAARWTIHQRGGGCPASLDSIPLEVAPFPPDARPPLPGAVLFHGCDPVAWLLEARPVEVSE